MSKAFLISYGADFADAKIVEYESKVAAAEAAFKSTSPGKLVFQTETDLESLGGPELVALYNSLNGGEAINKFRDLATARSRVRAIIYGLNESAKSDTALGKAVTEKKSARKSAENRKGTKYGKMDLVKKIKVLKPNPRRAGTAGFKSFALITEGMTVQAFLDAGGRRVDLKWDIEKGNIALEE